MDSGFFILELLLIFVVPGIAAAIVKGGAGRKVIWYLGTGALVYLTDVLVPVANVLLSVYPLGTSFKELDRGTIELVAMFAMLAVDVTMIALAAKTGKICTACQSRIHSKATRCPKNAKWRFRLKPQNPENKSEVCTLRKGRS